jgi:hypothetical protein
MRKPFKEALILLTWMCANRDEFLDNLWSNPRDTFDLGSIDDSKKLALINSVKLRCSGMGFVDATRLCSTIYDRKNEYGLAPLFDKGNASCNQESPYRY